MIEAQFPDKLRCLFEPKRYKVLWGGRGAGRSWGVARALLIMGTNRPLRILCAREFQNSVAESVHKVLSDQIVALGLEAFYDIQKQGIFGVNGTTFSFEGIKNNVNRIKSYEGVDICWVEEAVKVSRTSWGVLIPTIRKDGSEIWMTFNPELESDYTYQRFVKGAKESDSIVVHMTWSDNPFFPQVLKAELEAERLRDYDTYLNVWEGKCLVQLEGAVYANEMRRAAEDTRITLVPWERSIPVSTAWDLGRSDKTAIWFFQKVGFQLRVLAYYENNLQGDILFYAKELQSRPYTYDDLWLPHDAFAKRLGTKLTIQEQLQQLFPNSQTRKVPSVSLADGINAARIVMATSWWDEGLCEEGLKALQRYKYKILGYKEDGKTPVFSEKPIHDDEWSHGADAFRYLALASKSPAAARGALGTRVAAALEEAGRRARGLLPGGLEAPRSGGGGDGWMN